MLNTKHWHGLQASCQSFGEIDGQDGDGSGAESGAGTDDDVDSPAKVLLPMPMGAVQSPGPACMRSGTAALLRRCAYICMRTRHVCTCVHAPSVRAAMMGSSGSI